MKKILFLSILFLQSFFAFAQKDDYFTKDHILYPVEVYPQFPGGEAEMYKFIKERTVYTRSALEANTEGKVITRFVVKPNGSITDVQVMKGIHPDCDSIAIDIIKAMPKWEWSETVKSIKEIWYTLPIVFKLPILGIDQNEEVYTTVEEMPSYPGGIEDMYQFVIANLKYPLQENCVQGRVTIRFIVTKEGKIINPKIVRGLDPDLDKEALRIIGLMPDWIPGKRKGECVNVYYTVPIVFRVQD